MHINLNQVVETFEPWQLTVGIDGIDYDIRELSLLDLGGLQKADAAGADRQREILEGLFSDRKPDITRLSSPMLVALIASIAAAVQEILRKNSLRAAQEAARQMRTTPARSGTSS